MPHVERATVQVVKDGTAASCLTIAVFYYCRFFLRFNVKHVKHYAAISREI